jgi:DNA-binding winged helix-turn-helix (wHTH) protein/Flp pilus assembly protein TadD
MQSRLRFGEFELDPENYVLTRHGVAVKLARQPFTALLTLVQRAGTLVTRDALRQAVWGDETIVDFEHGLNTCIRHIRLVLEDEADSPRFIETVPRLGYRFKAAVTVLPQAERPRARRNVVAAIAATLLIAAVTLLLARGVLPLSMASATGAHREADELYLRGRLALEDPTAGNARTALELFEKVLAIDERYAAAYAGIADAYLEKPSSIQAVPPAVATSRAQRAIERALTLDDRLPEAHLSAAQLWMTLHDWSRAGREYERAIELAPNHSVARQDYALWLSYQERFDEALKQARLAESLDPLSIRARNAVAEVLRHARRFDQAITQAQRVLELDPNYGRAHAILGHCYLAKGKLDAAIEEHRRSSHSSGNLGFAYAVAGRTKEASESLAEMEARYAATQGGPGEIAMVYIGLRQYERAFEWLTRAVEDGSVWSLKVAIVWDPLRSDPRFDQLVRRSFYGS